MKATIDLYCMPDVGTGYYYFLPGNRYIHSDDDCAVCATFVKWVNREAYWTRKAIRLTLTDQRAVSVEEHAKGHRELSFFSHGINGVRFEYGIPGEAGAHYILRAMCRALRDVPGMNADTHDLRLFVRIEPIDTPIYRNFCIEPS